MSIKITQEIFEAFQRGDERIFEWIFAEYGTKIRKFIFGIIGSDIDSQELAQEVFIKLWENRENVLSNNSLIKYLYTMAKNESFRYIKQKTNNIHIYSDDVARHNDISGFNVENDYQAEELVLRIGSQLDKMRPQMRRVYRLSIYEEMSNEEIAKLLKIQKTSVENLISKARNMIRRAILMLLMLLNA